MNERDKTRQEKRRIRRRRLRAKRRAEAAAAAMWVAQWALPPGRPDTVVTARFRLEKSVYVAYGLFRQRRRQLAVLHKLAKIVIGIALMLAIAMFVFGGEASDPILKTLALVFYALSMAVSAIVLHTIPPDVDLSPAQVLNFYRQGAAAGQCYTSILARYKSKYKSASEQYRHLYEDSDRRMDWAIQLLMLGIFSMLNCFVVF